MSLGSDGAVRRYTVRDGAAEAAGIPIGAKIVGVNGVPCVAKDTIVSHIGESGGRVELTFMPPAGGEDMYGSRHAKYVGPPQTEDSFYSSSSSSESNSESD